MISLEKFFKDTVADKSRHKCFISYHHDNDQMYKDKFVKLFDNAADVFIDKSVGDGDIDDGCKAETIWQVIRDNYLSDSTVTIVLIGKETWRRKYVDWEISSSIRDTKNSSRSGLLGIFLPTHPDYGKDKYNPHIIPPRLYDNVNCGFAILHDWTENPTIVQKWIDEAFDMKDKINPDNSRKLFSQNRTTNFWKD